MKEPTCRHSVGRPVTPLARPVRAAIEALERRQLFAVAPGAGQVVPPTTTSITTTAVTGQPRITKTDPAGGATNVKIDAFVSGEVFVPNGGIDQLTLTDNTVFLKRTTDGFKVPAVVNTTGGGDAIVLTPEDPLEPNTDYTFTVTGGLKDLSGVSFTPLTSTFKTAAPVVVEKPAYKFEQVQLPTTNGQQYSAVHVQGDILYAATLAGLIYKFPLNPDGSLGTPQVIDTVRNAAGREAGKPAGVDRFVVGIAVDPSTWGSRTQHVLWISHTGTSGLRIGDDAGEDFTGKISKLSGTNLETIEDKVIHLPRSVRDHLTNQLLFNPKDKKIYFGQSSNTAMGAPDKAWGMRPEHLLSGTILKLDPDLLGATPLDAHTEDADPYYPFATGAPLTIYATGVRNAYDLVFHPNGKLYAPTNGSAAGGATPQRPEGSNVPGIPQVITAETDALYVIQPGKYYGHPNPTQEHYVLNGGNPTDGVDPFEVPQYPVGTQPDPLWQKPAFDFGQHQSPNGALTYWSQPVAFGAALKNKILVARYSGGDDVIVLTVGADGAITKDETGIPGLTGLNNPVDIVEHWGSGNLYVTEFGETAAEGKITLLRPTTKDPEPAPAPPPIGEPVPPPPPALVLSQPSVAVAEGKSAAGTTAKLSAQPAADVTVAVTRQSGDANLSVAPGRLVFTPENWATPQPLTVSAADDDDATNGSSVFALSGPGLATVTLTADEIDDDVVVSPPPPPAPPPVPPPVPPPPPDVPAVDLAAEVSKAVVPASVATQTRFKGSLAIRVTNAGDISLSGLVPISVRLTAGDAARADDPEIFRTFKSLRLKPGQAKVLKFRMPMLPDVPAGRYRLSVVLDPENAIVERSEQNNAAVSADEYVLADPFTDVSGAYRGPPTGLAIGRPGRATLDLTNAGNVPAAGTITVSVLASIDDKAGANDVLVATIPVRLRLNAGSAKSLKLRLVLPPDLTPGTYFLIARVDVGDLPDPVRPNNDVASEPLAL